jgi:beta-galactosidase
MNPLTKSKRADREEIPSVIDWPKAYKICLNRSLQNFVMRFVETRTSAGALGNPKRFGSCLHERNGVMNSLTKSKRAERKEVSSVINWLKAYKICLNISKQNFVRRYVKTCTLAGALGNPKRLSSCLHERNGAMNSPAKSKRAERKEVSSVIDWLKAYKICLNISKQNFVRRYVKTCTLAGALGNPKRLGSCLHEPIIGSSLMRTLLLSFCAIFLLGINFVHAQRQPRKDISLNADWITIADEKNNNTYDGFQEANYNTLNWKKVNVPHNWDQYEGYQRKLHGNKHGYAWYRRTFRSNEIKSGKRFFLYFEGVGSYATVWLNGKKVGDHAGGRTTFTLDVTSAIKLNNQENILAVRADHPANIQDLPWVDGGCSTERGFSEGSQPMGIFRPVHLIVTSDIRIEPFGIHIWNDNKISAQSAILNLSITIKNYGSKAKNITVVNRLLDSNGNQVKALKKSLLVSVGKEIQIDQQTDKIIHPKLWSLENPYRYTLQTTITENGKVLDELKTLYGIRWISWPSDSHRMDDQTIQKQFLLNGKPVFINGIAEYEHLIGQSHAFSNEQIRARVMQIKAAGFNAFRDAHQPHNLLYSDYWDKEGILCWTQMAAHIWYDTPEFRKNFKKLLTDWVKERRNSPAVVLWGLENESTLPEDFAKECTELIRKLDPTASSQRKVTTCNGGKGTDWDVPQNWTGTYGGNPLTYGEDLQRQVLVGEYGAWRTIDLHATDANGKGYTENKMTDLMETKVRLAESVKDKTTGHFFWLYSSHDNPGRVQGGEGLRDLDRVGPVNYKGMFTPWEEPTDVFYMFRANYAPKATAPMVYIVSHTWPNRWHKPGIKDSVVVYSNCDEVELFNDIDGQSLGKQKRGEIGTHFQWNKPDIQYNVLYAVGYVNGKAVAKDQMVLQNLPQSPNFNRLITDKRISVPEQGYQYVYRVNCGGGDYTDADGSKWSADRNLTSSSNFGSSSWTANFAGIPTFFASQRRTFQPIEGTKDWKLFQTFRYGRDQLKYHFPLPDGEYLVELYFIEPWLGIGGGLDAKAMRLFDVALNGRTAIKDLDIWREAGSNALLKKTIKTTVKGGFLDIDFPEVKVGQAVISAIAIASLNPNIQAAPAGKSLLSQIKNAELCNWLDIGEEQFKGENSTFTDLPSNLYGAEWLKALRGQESIEFTATDTVDTFIALNNNSSIPQGFEDTKTLLNNSKDEVFNLYRKRLIPNERIIFDSRTATVFVLPVSHLQPAYDLKTTISYKATDGILEGNEVVKAILMDKERVLFNTANQGSLTWKIGVGVADTYSLTIKYHNPLEQPLKGKLEFLSADGTLMKTEMVEFAPTKTGKWNYLSTNTGSMINAGSYKLRLIAIQAKGLAIDALDVQ